MFSTLSTRHQCVCVLLKDIRCHVWPYSSMLAYNQIRRQATHKMGCQPGDLPHVFVWVSMNYHTHFTTPSVYWRVHNVCPSQMTLWLELLGTLWSILLPSWFALWAFYKENNVEEKKKREKKEESDDHKSHMLAHRWFHWEIWTHTRLLHQCPPEVATRIKNLQGGKQL